MRTFDGSVHLCQWRRDATLFSYVPVLRPLAGRGVLSKHLGLLSIMMLRDRVLTLKELGFPLPTLIKPIRAAKGF